MSKEAGIGFPGQGEIEAIERTAKGLRGWSTWRGQRPSPWVESTRNGEYHKGEDRRG